MKFGNYQPLLRYDVSYRVCNLHPAVIYHKFWILYNAAFVKPLCLYFLLLHKIQQSCAKAGVKTL